MAALICMKWCHGHQPAVLKLWCIRNSTPSIDAKFRPDPIWTNGSLGFFEEVAPNKKKNNKKISKMSSNMRSVPYPEILCDWSVCWSMHVSMCACLVTFKTSLMQSIFSGKLTLKIPWKNLYTEPTSALLDGLYVVVVPNTSIHNLSHSYWLLTTTLNIRKRMLYNVI